MAGKKKNEKESLATYRRIVWYDQKIAAGTYPSVKTFMEKWEISESTVHRDLDALRDDFGAAEYLAYDKFKKGYYYTSSTFRVPGMIATERQVVSAQLMANLLEMIRGTPIYSKAIEVFTALSTNIEQDTRLNAKKLSNRIVFLGMSPVHIEDETWGVLEEALSKNRYVCFDYEKNGKIHKVNFAPYQLIYYNGMWTLYGMNDGYKGLRFFNLPVIKNIQLKNETFVLPENFAYEKHAIGNFGRHIGAETFVFKLQITAPWIADYARTYDWAPDQKFEAQDDGSTIMTFTSNQYYPVLDWVLEKGKFVKPLQPQKLVADWKDNAIAMAKMAEEM